jgi:hypothetical protein
VEIGEALAFAVSLLNQKNGKYKHLFPGKKIGFAFIDSCNLILIMAFACLSSGVQVRIKYGCSILSLKMAAVDAYAIWIILRRDKITFPRGRSSDDSH